MLELKGSQKRMLRAMGSKLKPVIHIGKNGLSEQVLLTIDEALNDHELIKIKYLEFKDERKEFNTVIVEKCECVLAGSVGHTALFYRPGKEDKKNKIKLPQ